jgi:uncharacterized protein (TIGR02679 family)
MDASACRILMDPAKAARLRAIFDAPALRWIVDRLAARLAAGTELRGNLTRAAATPEERRAVDDLLGRKSTRGVQLTLALEALEWTLRAAELLERLEEIVLACRGPVENRRAQADQLHAAWRAVFASARAKCRGRAGLLDWINQLVADGTLKRASRGDIGCAAELLEKALQILQRDPAREILLATLAASCTGDSHSLDRGQPLATLCLRGITVLHGIEGQASPEERRRAWATVGVVVDDLSAPVLVFNLRAAPGSALEEVLAVQRRLNQPAYFSYRQLHGGNPFLPLGKAMRRVFVCENPSVVSSAALALGPCCQPMVCTNGHPTSTVHTLLAQLHQAGAELHCHADFDWPGLMIVDQLIRKYEAVPWRMKAADYHGQAGTVPLPPLPFVSAWDPDLADVLRSGGAAVFEEQVIEGLLADLYDTPPLPTDDRRNSGDQGGPAC